LSIRFTKEKSLEQHSSHEASLARRENGNPHALNSLITSFDAIAGILLDFIRGVRNHKSSNQLGATHKIIRNMHPEILKSTKKQNHTPTQKILTAPIMPTTTYIYEDASAELPLLILNMSTRDE